MGSHIQIVPFAKRFARATFSCGHPELDKWLRTQAGQQERSGNTRTFLAVVDDPDPRVVGYYATTAYRLELPEASRAFGRGRQRYPIPAVLLARLAVDQTCQGQGLGGRLLLNALSRIAEASSRVGFQLIVVHAIDETAAEFYRHVGFAQFADHSLDLFLTVRDLTSALRSADASYILGTYE